MARDRTLSFGLPSNSLRFELDLDNISVSSTDENESLDSPSESAFFQSFPRGTSAQRPLISFVTNKWDTSRSSRTRSLSSSSSASLDWQRFPWLASILSFVMAPRFKRYLVVYFVLVMLGVIAWQAFLQPMMEENENIAQSLNVNAPENTDGWFGTNLRPEFADIVPMGTLDPAFLPSPEKKGNRDPSRKRLVVVGDVHGCQDELEKLLKKISFDQTAGDHLVFTGDMIHKGPFSAGVVDIARELGASCVRGNHEDRILLERSVMKLHDIESSDFTDKNYSGQSDTIERKTAIGLSDEQAAWLEECPVILKVGQVTGMGEVVVVHGGLVPGVKLERQELSSVMSMRTIDLKTHVPSSSKDGVPWFKLFNQYHKLQASEQKQLGSSSSETVTVIYGHDASQSLNIRPFTKGLDSGCVYGRKLSAFIIEDGGVSEVVQVKCKEYVKS